MSKEKFTIILGTVWIAVLTLIIFFLGYKIYSYHNDYTPNTEFVDSNDKISYSVYSLDNLLNFDTFKLK